MPAQILVVEDENIVAMNLQNRLQSLGYSVSGVAATAEEALARAGETVPDLVLMDIRLKGDQDGVAAAEALRARHGVPVVYLTAYADSETLSRARMTEPAGYLLKPFEARELQTAIELALHRHGTEKRLRQSEERYALAAAAGNDGIWDWDLIQGRVHYSLRWKLILGYNENEIGTEESEWFSRVHDEDLPRLEGDIDRLRDGVIQVLENEYRLRHRDGTWRWVQARALVLRDSTGRATRMLGAHSDVTRRRVAEEKLIQFAFYDPLTDLPNQVAFVDRLWSVMRGRRRANAETAPAAVVLFELQGLEAIAAGPGPSVLNAFILQAARRLEKFQKERQVLARLDGARFGLLLEGMPAEQIENLTRAIQDVFARPFLADHQEFFFLVAAGYALARPAHDRPEDLLRDAAAALQESKDAGEVCRFDQASLERLARDFEVKSRVSRAFARNEWEILYKPVVRQDSEELAALEAVLYWRDPNWGLLEPREVLQAARAAGASVRLDEYVVRAASAFIQRAFPNSSVLLIVRPAPESAIRLVDRAPFLAKEAGLDPARLVLDVSGMEEARITRPATGMRLAFERSLENGLSEERPLSAEQTAERFKGMK